MVLGLTHRTLMRQSLEYIFFGEGETGLLVYSILVRYWEAMRRVSGLPLILLVSESEYRPEMVAAEKRCDRSGLWIGSQNSWRHSALCLARVVRRPSASLRAAFSAAFKCCYFCHQSRLWRLLKNSPAAGFEGAQL